MRGGGSGVLVVALIVLAIVDIFSRGNVGVFSNTMGAIAGKLSALATNTTSSSGSGRRLRGRGRRLGGRGTRLHRRLISCLSAGRRGTGL